METDAHVHCEWDWDVLASTARPVRQVLMWHLSLFLLSVASGWATVAPPAVSTPTQPHLRCCGGTRSCQSPASCLGELISLKHMWDVPTDTDWGFLTGGNMDLEVQRVSNREYYNLMCVLTDISNCVWRDADSAAIRPLCLVLQIISSIQPDSLPPPPWSSSWPPAWQLHPQHHPDLLSLTWTSPSPSLPNRTNPLRLSLLSYRSDVVPLSWLGCCCL